MYDTVSTHYPSVYTCGIPYIHATTLMTSTKVNMQHIYALSARALRAMTTAVRRVDVGTDFDVLNNIWKLLEHLRGAWKLG